MRKLKKMILVLCACYAVAYMLAGTIERYQVKNQYEKNKIESYKAFNSQSRH